MTAEQRTLIRRARDAHARTQQHAGSELARPGQQTLVRFKPEWGHCQYCGVSRIRTFVCAKHKDLLTLDTGKAHG